MDSGPVNPTYAQYGFEIADFCRHPLERPGITHSLVMSNGRLVSRSPQAVSSQYGNTEPITVIGQNQVTNLLELGGDLAIVLENTLVIIREDGSAHMASDQGNVISANASDQSLALLTPNNGLQCGTFSQQGTIELQFLAMAPHDNRSLMAIVRPNLVAVSFLGSVTVYDKPSDDVLALPANVVVRPAATMTVSGGLRSLIATGERYVAAGDENGGVWIWDVDDSGGVNPPPVFHSQLHSGPVGALTATPEGNVRSAGTDGQVFDINPATGQSSGPLLSAGEPIIDAGFAGTNFFLRLPFGWASPSI